jgi:hypothetical protein
MPGLEIATTPLTLPAWAVAGAAVLCILIAVLSLWRAGAKLAGAIVRTGFALAICGAVVVLLQQNAARERLAERRALDQRAAELAARVITPGSPLACLDAVAGDAVESACEKAVFASPATVAAAVSYVTARLALLSDSIDFARRTGGGYESALATLRVAIESDRYGIVAHVLSVRDSCTPLLCDSYVLFKDPDRVQANLRDRLFDRYVERYTAEWARTPAVGTPVAETPAGSNFTTASVPPAAAPAAPAAGTVTTPAAAPGAPPSAKYDFPSATSIPAVSIMTPEPAGPPETKPPTPTAPAAAPAAPRRPQHPAPRAATRPAPPQQPIGPPPSAQPAPTAANGPALH